MTDVSSLLHYLTDLHPRFEVQTLAGYTVYRFEV